MQTFAAQDTLRWQNLKAEADYARTQIQANNAYVASDSSYIPPLALAWQITRDPSYAQAAIADMLSVCVSTNTLTGDDYYNYRSVLPDVSSGYDWCYDQIAPTDRATIAGWLMDRADAVWPDTNPARTGGWAVADPANNYFYGFLTTWTAALAVYGDEPRAVTHLALARSKFVNLVEPWASSWGKGGLFAEGTGYDSTHGMALLLDGEKTACGDDLINASNFSYLRESVQWRLQSTTPDNYYHYGLGEQTQHITVDDHLGDYDRMRMLIVGDNVRRPDLAGYAQLWLETINPPTCTWDNTTAWEFLFFNENAPTLDYRTYQPMTYFASGPGMFVQRTDWTPNATYWGAWAGPLLEGHQDENVNGFQIFKNGWLASNAAMWSQDGTYADTIYHNNFTFNGLGQQWQAVDTVDKTLAAEAMPRFGIFEGQGAGAYGGSVQVNDYVRKIVHIVPDIFIVKDRVTLANPSLPVEWHLHNKTAITTNGLNYQFDNGNYALYGAVLTPTRNVTVSAVAVQPTYDPAPSSYRVDAVSTSNAATTTMVNTMQLVPVGGPAPGKSVALKSDSKNASGVWMRNWLVWIGDSEQMTGAVSYHFKATAGTHHLVMDLYPSTSYQLTSSVTLNGTTTTTQVKQMSDSQGVLVFDELAGSVSVTVEPTTPIVPPPPTSLLPVADTFVNGGASSTTNFGSLTEMVVKKATADSDRAAYIMFDLTKVDQAPTKATLTLTVTGDSNPVGATETVGVYDLGTTSWLETQLTAANAPGLDPTSWLSTCKLLSTQQVVLNAGPVSIDITAWVQKHMGTVASLQLLNPNADGLMLGIASREASTGKPVITLTY